MSYYRALKVPIITLLAVMLLAGCQSNGSTPPAATAIPPAGDDNGNPPGAPTATQAANPTATPAPVVSTLTPIPTSTPAGDGNGDGDPAPAPTTAAIPGLIGPDNFPDDVNPLTGRAVGDPAILDRRPVAVKISNYPPVVRPQSGLNNADLVFEHYAEGGVTRFTAIFYGRDADPVGSIRSGRIIDLEIPKMYDAAFAYSGASGPVREMFRTSTFFDRIISPDFGHGGFFRVEDPNKAFEHTLFTSTGNLRAILEERGENTAPDLQTHMSFSEEAPAGGTAGAASVSSLEIQYQSTNGFWQYNPGTGRYTRWTDGQPHNDANTGQQLSFRNVIVVAAHHEDTDILEDFVGGGSYSIQIQIWGEGPVSIFRDGQRFDGRWRRADPGDMLTFYDGEGNVLPLAPGNSFVQLVPLGFTGLTTTE